MTCDWWILDADVADSLRLDEAADDSLYLVHCFGGPPVDFVVEVSPTTAGVVSVTLAAGFVAILWEVSE